MAKEQKQEPENKQDKNVKTKVLFLNNRAVMENTDSARELYNQSRYGEIQKDGKIQLSMIECLYLLERGKIEVSDGKNKSVDFDAFMNKASKKEPNIWVRFVTYKDLRNRGYIVKTALKFGADFRVYDRGVKPGEDHAKWVVFPVHESSVLTWYEFAAKNRVAHSTKKRLLLAVADDESDVSFWECRWVRP